LDADRELDVVEVYDEVLSIGSVDLEMYGTEDDSILLIGLELDGIEDVVLLVAVVGLELDETVDCEDEVLVGSVGLELEAGAE